MRSRNIKPGFFRNELLGQCSPMVRLLFAGLWCLADRDGILEDRPARIKADVFPYDTVDLPLLNGYLTELSRLGFILRYESDGNKLIHVVNFNLHQSPHKTEKQSVFELPCVDDIDSCRLTVDLPLDNGGNPPDSLIHPFTDSSVPTPSPVKKKAASVNKELPPIPEHVLAMLEDLVALWPRKSVYGEEVVRVIVLARPEFIWERVVKFVPEKDWELSVKCGLAYIDEINERPKNFRGLIPNVCVMTNFWGEKELWKKMVDRVECAS